MLFLPQVEQLPSPLQVVCHDHAEAVFKVDFPRGIKRICCPFDLGVSFDRDTRGGEQFDSMGPTCFVLSLPTEHPVTVADDVKVLVLDPSARLVRVPASGPLPQRPEERVIHFGEGLFTRHMAMIVRPSPEERIELSDQVFWLGLCVGANECTGFGQEGVDTFAGRFHENGAVIVSDVLAEKVKAL